MNTYTEPYRKFKARVLKNLKLELKLAGLSQREQIFAGLDPRYISRIKAGKKNITLRTVWKICYAVGINPSRLFK